MRDILPRLDEWSAQHKKMAIATVTDVFTTAPRGIGAKMLISSTGEMIGSVSAGCVEGAVVEEALQVIESGKPKNLHYGIEDSQAWGLGLMCGGKIEIFLEAVTEESDAGTDRFYPSVRDAVTAGSPFMLVTVLEGDYLGRKILLHQNGDVVGSTGFFALDEGILQAGKQLWRQFRSEKRSIPLADGAVSVFFDMQMPPERLVIVGATHIAIALVNMAKEMGFYTLVIDPRAAFLTRERFPRADELLKAWPQEVLPGLRPDASTYLVILTHDAKLDVPALDVGLKHPFRYLGLLGSKTTQEDRKAELLKMGYNEDQLHCIHGPIGIKIGSRLPEEIAVSILAEIISVRRGVMKS